MDNTIQAITYTVARTRDPNIWINYDWIFTMLPKPKLASGSRIQVPLTFSQLPVEFFRGTEAANASRGEWKTAAYYEWVTGRANMVYALEDRIKNDGGENAIIDYVTSLMENSEKSFTDKMVQHFCGSGTDATLRQFNSFQHLANDSADTLSTGTTLGTLDKAVVADADGVLVYSGNVMDVQGAGHGPTRSNIIRFLHVCTNGPSRPDLIVFHQRVIGEIVAQAAGTTNALVRYPNQNALKIGFEVYEVEGIKMYGLRHIPFSTTVPGTNKGLFIHTKSTQVVIHKNVNFVLRPWVKIPLQEAWYAARVVAGNTVCDDPRSNGVMTNFAWNATAD